MALAYPAKLCDSAAIRRIVVSLITDEIGRATRRDVSPAVVAGWSHDGTRGAGRLGGTLRRDRTELMAAAVLALAILAALTSWGALDIAGAAAEPAPITAGPAGD